MITSNRCGSTGRQEESVPFCTLGNTGPESDILSKVTLFSVFLIRVVLGWAKCLSSFDLSSNPWASRADAFSSTKWGNWGSQKWTPFWMLPWPVSVPAHTGSPCLLTTRPASLLPHQAAPQVTHKNTKHVSSGASALCRPGAAGGKTSSV